MTGRRPPLRVGGARSSVGLLLLPGQPAYLVGAPEPTAARTGRVTCVSRVTPTPEKAGASAPLLELSVSGYTDAVAAGARRAATVAAQEAQGARTGRVQLPTAVAGQQLLLAVLSQDGAVPGSGTSGAVPGSGTSGAVPGSGTWGAPPATATG